MKAISRAEIDVLGKYLFTMLECMQRSNNFVWKGNKHGMKSKREILPRNYTLLRLTQANLRSFHLPSNRIMTSLDVAPEYDIETQHSGTEHLPIDN
jgi:hypothetical protein